MPSDHNRTAANPLPIARIALVVATLIAVAAIGLSVWKNRDSTKPATATAQDPVDDVATMIAKLEAKLKDNPNDAEGWKMLGWAFYQTGKYAESAQAYARSTQLDPNKSESWSALGEARVLAGPGEKMPADAKVAFQRAVALDPQDPRARYFLAVAKDMDGDHKGAIDAWFALLKDTPAGAPWEADVRRVISEVGAKEKIEVTSRLGAVRPAPPNSGVAIATSGIPGPSPEQMRSAAQLPKGQQDALVDGMVNGLEAKLKANPDNPQGWIMLMRSRMQLGQSAKASEAFRSGKAAFANQSTKRGQLEAAAAELGISG